MGMMDRLKKTMTGEDESPADADILDTLKQEHDDVADMLDRLVTSTAATERKKLLTSIKTALVPHLRGEEKAVYELVRGMRGKEQQTHAQVLWSTRSPSGCSANSAE
jgi:hypothetical protein